MKRAKTTAVCKQWDSFCLLRQMDHKENLCLLARYTRVTLSFWYDKIFKALNNVTLTRQNVTALEIFKRNLLVLPIYTIEIEFCMLPLMNLSLIHGPGSLLLRVLSRFSNWTYFIKCHHESLVAMTDHVNILVHRKVKLRVINLD